MSADGILVVDKPEGMTSRAVTNRISRLLREKKAGHLGTLDPIARGALPVALGKATRLVRFLERDDKLYRAVIRLGRATDTLDREGKTTGEGEWKHLSPDEITAAALGFRGQLLQTPPMHSALKKNGVPLYQLARKGIETEREPRAVTVFELEVEKLEPPEITIRVLCSPGTYLRVIAHDLGQKLGSCAHLADLTRLRSGPFSLEQAVKLDELEEETARQNMIPLEKCLPRFPALELSPDQAEMIRDGVALAADQLPEPVAPDLYYRLTRKGALLAVARATNREGRLIIKPERVFA